MSSLLRALSAATTFFIVNFISLCPVLAQQEQGENTVNSEASTNTIVVTGAGISSSLKDSPSSVSVLTEQQLVDGQYRNASAALRQVPGVDVVQSGGNGGNSSIFIRGGNSEHTLVLLDGIELNNPATTNRSFNLANLTLENIERIEVIRGPQSTIYGSDAMGGVINLVSKRAQKGVHTALSSEAGSYNSATQVGSISYGSESLDLSTGITRQDIGGISAADARFANGEQDDYQNTSITNRIRVSPSEDLEATNTLRFTRSHTNLDNGGGVGFDDPNRIMLNNELFTRGDVTAKLADGTVRPSAYISYTRHSLDDRNSIDTTRSDGVDILDSAYNGDIVTAGSKIAWDASDLLALQGGVETQGERASSFFNIDGAYGPYEENFYGREARTNSAYLESKLNCDGIFFLDSGLRHDNHSIFGAKTTFKVAPALRLAELTKLRGSVGTGFKSPSLVQLYSSYGNVDLGAESSTGWDIGVEQELVRDLLSSSIAFFRNDYRDLITFDPSSFRSENIARANTQGFEVGLNYDPIDPLTFRLAYTYTDTENEDSGAGLLRRPRNKAALTTVYSPTKRLRAQLQWRVYSSRFDSDFSAYPPERVSLAGYGLLDIALSYQVFKDVEIFGRVDNLLDQEYQEVLGFGAMGAAAYGGVKVEL
jgi:vitamin B12 transporter